MVNIWVIKEYKFWYLSVVWRALESSAGYFFMKNPDIKFRIQLHRKWQFLGATMNPFYGKLQKTYLSSQFGCVKWNVNVLVAQQHVQYEFKILLCCHKKETIFHLTFNNVFVSLEQMIDIRCTTFMFLCSLQYIEVHY